MQRRLPNLELDTSRAAPSIAVLDLDVEVRLVEPTIISVSARETWGWLRSINLDIGGGRFRAVVHKNPELLPGATGRSSELGEANSGRSKPGANPEGLDILVPLADTP